MTIDQHIPSSDASAVQHRANETSGPGGLRSKPAVRAAGVAVLLTMMLTGLLPAHADAATLSSTAGRTGTIWMNGPMINAWDLGTRLSNGTTFYTKNFNVGGITVGRSPSSSSQRVTVVSALQRWDGRWVNIQTRTRSGVVSGTGTVKFPEWTWSPTGVPNNRKSYRVIHGVYWYDLSSGQLLALTALLPNTVADNRCSTLNFRCTSYTDGLNF
jgi:hypothetical protein